MLGHQFLDSYLHFVFLMILFYDCLELVFGTEDKEDPPRKELKKQRGIWIKTESKQKNKV